MPGSVGFEQLGNIRNKRIIGVGIGEEGANTEQNLGYGKGWAPLVLKNIEANSPIGVDVTMINARGEMHLGGFEGVVCREVDVEEENSSCIRGFVGAHNGRLPMKHIVSNRSSRAIRRRILSKVDKFLKWGDATRKKWVGGK